MTSITCHACGRDLAGTASMTCPACGARPDFTTPRAPDAPRPRHELLRPVVLLGLGAAAITLYILAEWSYTLPSVLSAIGLQALLGVAVFVVSTITWIGAEDPMPLNLLRLASIYAATWGILLPVTHLPLIYFMMLTIPFVMFIVLHITMLGLELSEAFILAMLNAVVYIAAGFVLVAG